MKVSVAITSKRGWYNGEYRYLCSLRPESRFVSIDNARAVIENEIKDESILIRDDGEIYISGDQPYDQDGLAVMRIVEILSGHPITILELCCEGEEGDLIDHMDDLKKIFGKVNVVTYQGLERNHFDLVDIEGFNASVVYMSYSNIPIDFIWKFAEKTKTRTPVIYRSVDNGWKYVRLSSGSDGDLRPLDPKPVIGYGKF